MSRKTMWATALILPLAAGAEGQVAEHPMALPAQSEIVSSSSSEYGTTIRFRDENDVLVERFTSTGTGRTTDKFFGADGSIERVVNWYSDGRVDREDRVYGAAPSESPTLDGSSRHAFARGFNLSPSVFEDLLSRLPPLPRTSRRRELDLWRGRYRDGKAPEHPWGHHWKEGDGGEFPDRTVFRLLHQEMEVESERVGPNELRISDSRGGQRHDTHWETSTLESDCHCLPFHAVVSYDALGRIVHVVVNDDGYPTETWYGETLIARYHYAHVDGVRPFPSGGSDYFWLELLDVRTGGRLLDTRALPTMSSRPSFRAGGHGDWGVIEAVGDDLFAVVNHNTLGGGHRYALLPLGEGPVWRTVWAAGTEHLELFSVVNYTDDRFRIEFQLDHTDLVVEAPRRGDGAITVSWPEDITLPLLLPDKGPIEH